MKVKYKQSKLGEWLADQEGHSASEYGDIEDLVKEIYDRVRKNERVLVMALTKKNE